MERFLNNYMDSLTSRRRVRVGDLLSEATVTQEQIAIISQNLSNLSNLAPIVLRSVAPSTFVNTDSVMLNLRDVQHSMNELYNISNLISLLLDSHAAVLGADVKAIDDQLIALEKMANNYAFLLSDGGAFNYAYLEPFSDDRGRDSFSFNIPDRDGTTFGPSEQAIVRSTEGILAIPQDLTSTHGLTGEILKGNASGYVVVDTGLRNALTATSATGWRYIVSSTTPVTSSLSEANGNTGAQLLLEFTLSNPAPSSAIKLVPFADMAMELVQVIIYESTDNSNPTPLLTEPQILDRDYTLHFPMQAVAKFRVLINQPTYNRTGIAVDTEQQKYQDLFDAVQERRALEDRYDIRRIQQVIRGLYYASKNNTQFSNITFPALSTKPLWGPLSWGRGLMSNIDVKFGEVWSESEDKWEKVILDLYASNPTFYRDLFLRGVGDDSINIGPQPQAIVSRDNPTEHKIKFLDYRYNLGLKFIGIGANDPGYKGVFVSKPLPASGDIGELRIKVEDTNYQIAVSDLSSAYVTSTEYSVSNISTPNIESDWIPILPVNTEMVIAERLFVDNAGRGFLRFPANRTAALYLYKNGYSHDINATSYILDTASQNVIGITLPFGDFTSDDIFTCDYIPAADNTTISFNLSGASDTPLISSYDNTGVGEGFENTGGRNTIDLKYTPYIDYNQVNSSTYFPTTGMSPYQPVTVRLDNGIVVTNLTNYKIGDQTSLPIPNVGYTPPQGMVITADIVTDPITHEQISRVELYHRYGTIDPNAVNTSAINAANGYYYIHSGNVLMFNRPLDQPFRVYYQYLQNAVRVRVVLRVNTKNFVTPTVDAFHVKTKTRRADARERL
jgi:hypothetical protein